MSGPRAVCSVAAAAMSLLCGCGAVQYGADARVPVAERHILAAGSPAGQNLQLPGDRGFNIHVKQSSQNLGAKGEARGSSDATAQGRAFADAVAERGGAAKAEFKLGHRVDNNSPAAQRMVAAVNFSLQQAMDASTPPSAETLAKAELLLLVIDSHKRVVSKTLIVQANSDESTGNASLPQQRDLAAQLEPGESYDIVLFGQVDAASSDNERATARLDVEQLQINLTFSPVTTRPASDVRP